MTNQIDQFIEDLKRQEFSLQTLRAYRCDLDHFTRWFTVSNGEGLTAERITPTDLRTYKSHQQTVQNLKPATINRRLAAIRRFVSWAQGQGLISGDPTKDVEAVPTIRTAPRALTRSELNRLTRAAEQDALTGTHQGKRNLAIVQALRYTGVRVGELVALTREDLEISERKGSLTVRSGKGGKFREVPLNVEVRRALSDYLEVRPDIASDRVFIGQRGPLTADGVRKLVAKYAARADLQDVTPHVLRHSFGKGALDAGVNLVTVATLLGHERLETTAIYTRPSKMDLEAAVAKLETG
jgi:integrase/recombinase XerC